MPDGSNQRVFNPADHVSATPSGSVVKPPAKVHEFFCQRANAYSAATSRTTAAWQSLSLAERLIRKYQGQIPLHLAVIDDALCILRDSDNDADFAEAQMALYRHLRQLDRIVRTKTPQLWTISQSDIRSSTYIVLDLYEAGHPKKARQVLRAVETTCPDPKTTLAHIYAELDPIQLHTPHMPMPRSVRLRRMAAALRAKIRSDRPDPHHDLWRGYNCQRPLARTNRQWEMWMFEG